MKSVEIKARYPYLAGSYGMIFVDKKVCTKLIGQGHSSKSLALESEDLDDTVCEATLLKLSQSSGISPKLNKVSIRLYRGKFYPAIEMEFIEGTYGNDFLEDNHEYVKVNAKGEVSEKGTYASDYIKSKLSANKIVHADLHDGNIVVQGKKVFCLDFGPNAVTYLGEETTFLAVMTEIMGEI